MGGETLHLVPEEEAFDASDPKEVKKRELAAQIRERDDRKVLIDLLSTPKGRNWVWSKLLTPCHVFGTSFEPGDALTMAFREGERNIGLALVAQITAAAPDAMIKMMQEKGNG